MEKKPRARSGKRGRRIFLALVFAATAAGIVIFYQTGLKPFIHSLNPAILSSDGSLSVTGAHFGNDRNQASVLVDGIPLTASSYLSWGDSSISLKLPRQSDSGMVVVKTVWGDSNPVMFINANDVPIRTETVAVTTTGPVIESVNPGDAKIGSLITITGINFGSGSQPGTVRFPKTSQDSQNSSRTTGSTQYASQILPYIEPSEDPGMYESWDDKKIQVRVPDGSGSGNIVIHTDRGDSNPIPLHIINASASKYGYNQVVYSVQEKVTIRNINSKPGGILDIYLPLIPNTPAQNLLAIQEQFPQIPSMSTPLFEMFRFQSPESGKDIEVRQQMLVSVESVEGSLDGYSANDVEKTVAPFLQPFLASDDRIPSADKSIVSGVLAFLAGETNPQKKVAKLWDWMKRTISWTSTAAPLSRKTPALDAFKDHKADTKTYVFLSCALLRAAGVPAVPVAGLLVKKNGETVPHFWLEYYLAGVGWIPFDPVLGLGVRPGFFDAALEDSSHYLGSLDNHHIALTRGFLDVGANLHTSSKVTAGKAAWSFQNLFEESSQVGYISSWAVPEVLGTY
jgi:transglutaminase-like putative cysteine protease